MSDWYSTPHWTPEPIVAYRGWSWNGSHLIGPNNVPWTSPKMKAEHPSKGHKSPHPGCLCGMNAYKDPLGPRDYNILGKVHLSGVVDEYHLGYRAEWAEIVEIFIYAKYLSSVAGAEMNVLLRTSGPFPKEDIDMKMERTYGVPVIRGKRIGWRPENHEITVKEQQEGEQFKWEQLNRWQK